MKKEYPIVCVPKPRMTRQDKWRARPCVVRYRAFKDRVRELQIDLVQPCKVTFNIAMPKSWSKKKRALLRGEPHMETPDIDNLVKGLLDALYADDAHVWSVWAEKRWAEMPSIWIEDMRAT